MQVVASELGSKLDPVLVLTDADGAVLAEGTSALGYRGPEAGTYAIGIRDREFRGGADFHYRLHVGDVPVVTGVFPLAVQRGRAADVHVEGVNLGATGVARVRSRSQLTRPSARASPCRCPGPRSARPR